MLTHRVIINGLARDLPVLDVGGGFHVAIFDMLDDVEITEAAAMRLSRSTPPEAQVLMTAQGKADALLHSMCVMSGLEKLVARKSKKPYMRNVVEATFESVTTQRPQTLYIDGEQAASLRGKSVVFVDDVISSGGTLEAAKMLLNDMDATLVGMMCVFTEGERRPDVVSLGHLPAGARSLFEG